MSIQHVYSRPTHFVNCLVLQRKEGGRSNEGDPGGRREGREEKGERKAVVLFNTNVRFNVTTIHIITTLFSEYDTTVTHLIENLCLFSGRLLDELIGQLVICH